MDTGLFSAIGAFLSLSWDFFTGVKVPGTDLSVAALLVGLFLANLGLRFLFMVLGVSVGPGDLDRAERHGILRRNDK